MTTPEWQAGVYKSRDSGKLYESAELVVVVVNKLNTETHATYRSLTGRERSLWAMPVSEWRERSLWAMPVSEFLAAFTYEGPIRTGAARIALERDRHQAKFDAAHDDGHVRGELALAAALYASPVTLYALRERRDKQADFSFCDPWPFTANDDKRDRSYGERLVIAGALLAAELDRRDRLLENQCRGFASHPSDRSKGPPCCEKAGSIFRGRDTCPKGCACHD